MRQQQQQHPPSHVAWQCCTCMCLSDSGMCNVEAETAGIADRDLLEQQRRARTAVHACCICCKAIGNSSIGHLLQAGVPATSRMLEHVLSLLDSAALAGQHHLHCHRQLLTLCCLLAAGDLSPATAWILVASLAVAGLAIVAANFGPLITQLYGFGLFLGTVSQCASSAARSRFARPSAHDHCHRPRVPTELRCVLTQLERRCNSPLNGAQPFCKAPQQLLVQRVMV